MISRTKSGLMIETMEAEIKGERRLLANEHPWLIRMTHWLNAVSLLIMTASGLQIFMAFPSFGEKIPQRNFVEIPQGLGLGGWLGGGLQWHYSFAWLFGATGVAYVVYLAVSGHWRQVILQPRDLAGLWPMARHYFFFQAKPEAREAYNPLQKLAYTSTIFLGVAAVTTGLLLSKPVQLDFLVGALGGFRMIRIYHFAAMAGFLSFIPGHLLMVALHGWNNFRSMLIGWKRDPDYLQEIAAGRVETGERG